MLADELIAAKKYPAASAVNCVSLDQPGYYAIHVNNPDWLGNHFGGIPRSRNTQLIYIGIATVSLRKRLIEEDLQHRRPSSFFRSLGAILGYRPPVGSLVGRRNQNNYQFNAADTQEIIEWINKHLFVSWVKSSHADKRDECATIKKNRPLLNLSQNPDALPELKQFREECRRIARSPILTKDT